MDQQEILRKIGGIIVELKEQHTYLQANSSSFNDLELELFMANANFLTDHIDILKKIYGNAKPVSASPVSEPEKTAPAKPVIPDYFTKEEHLPFADDPLLKKLNDFASAKETEQAASTKPEPVKEETNLPAQTAGEEPDPFVIADASFMAQKSVPTEAEEVKGQFFPEPEALEPVEEQEIFYPQESLKPETIVFEEQPEPVIAEAESPEAFSVKPETTKAEPALTLNERIAAQKGLDRPTAKTGFAGKTTQDLPSLINLNDKLLFIKELFNGYNLAYAEAITILNRYTNFEQAEQFLKTNYTAKNNWKDKPATAERFFDILRQRFT